MQRAGILLLGLLLGIPVASAAAVDVAIPEALIVSSSILLAGSVTSDDAQWDDLTFVGAEGAAFPTGSLTVCPRQQGTTLQQALRLASQECNGGVDHTDPDIRFGPATDVLFVGRHPIVAWPNASIVGFYGENTTALIPSADGLTLGREDTLFRFAPATPRASVEVEDAQGITYYNGSAFVFLHEAETVRMDAEGIVGGMGPCTVRVAKAEREALDEAMRPFVLLELQGAALGADAREPRANVTELFLEFGRVPAFVNGAMLGRINGTVAGVAFANETALIRGEFTLQRDERTLTGDVEPTVVIAEQGVAFSGRNVREPPWILAAIVWIVAALVLLVRRRDPEIGRLERWTWRIAPLLALVLADLAVLLAKFGTSALAELRGGGAPRAILSLAVFEIALVALSFLLLVLPVRIIERRTLRGKVQTAADVALAIVWLFVLVITPGATFALTHAVARL